MILINENVELVKERNFTNVTIAELNLKVKSLEKFNEELKSDLNTVCDVLKEKEKEIENLEEEL